MKFIIKNNHSFTDQFAIGTPNRKRVWSELNKQTTENLRDDLYNEAYLTVNYNDESFAQFDVVFLNGSECHLEFIGTAG